MHGIIFFCLWEKLDHKKFSKFHHLVRHQEDLFQISHQPTNVFLSDRAMFFAEIILYCNDFVCLDRALIALASVMNAIEGVYIEVSTEEERMIEKSIEDEFGIWYPQNQVEDLRSDIWHVFSMSAQYKVEDMMLEAIQAPKEPEGKKLTANDLGSEFSNSPTTVVKRPVRILE